MSSFMQRKPVVDAVVGWAAAKSRALFTGNGYLLRETAGSRDLPSHFYLFGGMGLAAAVATGYAAARPGCRAAVLEGDGNFLMGLPCAALCGSSGLDIVHIVYANGVYESTGGQPVPCVGEGLDAVKLAEGLGYLAGYEVSCGDELRHALERSDAAGGPSFIWVKGGAGSGPSGRPQIDPEALTSRFVQWSAQNRPER